MAQFDGFRWFSVEIKGLGLRGKVWESIPSLKLTDVVSLLLRFDGWKDEGFPFLGAVSAYFQGRTCC